MALGTPHSPARAARRLAAVGLALVVFLGLAAPGTAAGQRLGVWSVEQTDQIITLAHQRVGGPQVRYRIQVPRLAQSPITTQSGVVLSPNRRLVVFWGPNGGSRNRHAYLVQLASGRVTARPVIDPATRRPLDFVESAAFSPDSRELLLSSTSRVVVVELATGRTRTLLRIAPGSACLDPFWSPDGKSVGLLRVEHESGVLGCYGDAEFDILSVAGGGSRRMFFYDPVHDTPVPLVWSPDSQRIAFETDHFFPGDPCLAMLDIASAQVTVLSDRPRGPLAFMPDSVSLVIHDESGFVVRSPDGSERPLPVPSGSIADDFWVSRDRMTLVRWSDHAAFVRSLSDGHLVAGLHVPTGFSLDAVDWR
jgi:hypothetical protein